jgi:anti-sigma factor RsiW
MNRSLQHTFEAEEVMAYLDGELEPRRAAMLASHLEHCAECQSVAKNFRHVTERMLGFDVEAAPERIANNVLRALNSKQRDDAAAAFDVRRRWNLNWRSLFVSRAGWAFASGVLLVVVLLVAVPALYRSRESARVAHQGATGLSAPAGDVQRLRAESLSLDVPRPGLTMSEGKFSSESQRQLDANMESGARAAAPVPPSTSASDDDALKATEAVGPMIVQTASLSIVAKNYDEASAAIEKLVTARGGYVEKLDAKAQSGNARALSVALRIPAKQLDGFLSDLRKLGHVEEESQSNEEVSAEYVDLQARLKSAQATERRLIELLGTRTGKLEDVLDAERELGRMRGEIESMQGQSAVLVHRVSYATVQVQLSEEYHEKLQSSASTGTRLWNALVEGVQNLQDGIVGLLIFALNYGLAILFWLSILGAPAWLIWRRLRSRSLAKSGGSFQRT